MAQRDRDLLSVQNALRSLEDDRRKLGDAHSSDRFSIELEMERVKRDLAAAEDEIERARGEVDLREEALRQRDLERAQLLEKLRDLEARLASERQGRLNLSDKLDIATKVSHGARLIGQLLIRLLRTHGNTSEMQLQCADASKSSSRFLRRRSRSVSRSNDSLNNSGKNGASCSCGYSRTSTSSLAQM